jgi:4-amino-4-deoxy-L-arabinose transferase-like glycosyltransferase
MTARAVSLPFAADPLRKAGMATIAVTAPARWRVEIRALQLLVATFVGLRLYTNLNMDLLGDEAYYWMWGQRLGWSYFDHPPLHAWLLRVVEELVGWHRFNLRLLTWPTLAGTLAIFWAWAKRLAPEDPQLWFWRGAAIYLATPMYYGLTLVAYHDHLVVFLMLVAAHCFVLFVDRYETGARGAFRWLYAAALTVGLAALAKYSAVFLALGFGATFLIRAKLRPMLLTPYPWLAALLALATQTPVIWWNLVESGASFRYHFNDRWGGAVGTANWINVLIFIAQTLLFGSPFLVWPIVKVLRSRPAEIFASAAKTVAASTFLISTVALLTASLFMNAYFYWNIPGFAVVMLLLAGAMKSAWLRWAHVCYGLLWASLILLNFTIVPIGTLIQRQDNGSAINYDWSLIADRVRAAQAAAPSDLVASTRYSTTSQLGFVLGTTEAVKLSDEHSQYDYWQNTGDYAGKSAIILADDPDGSPSLTYLQDHFTTLTLMDQITVTRFGRYLYAWRIFRGEGFKP